MHTRERLTIVLIIIIMLIALLALYRSSSNTLVKLRALHISFLFMSVALIVFSAAPALAVMKSGRGTDLLLETYQKNMRKMEGSGFGLPLLVESYERKDRVHVDVYGIFDSPFSGIADALKIPANWCDIVSLHPNVKACTYQEQPGIGHLTFYVGSKGYQAPEDAHQVIYNYRNIEQRNDYMDVILTADEGPFGTEDHRMRFEALAVKGGGTFVHVSYEYSDSLALRLAGKAYFATLGHSKAGFTVTGTDESGNQTFIGGPRGAIERNAVRYYFAIQSFMNTQRYPKESRFNVRISEWFDLTTRYKRQLFDLDKKDYLTFKTSEHKNQIMLQRQLQ